MQKMNLQDNKQCLFRFRIEDLNERTLRQILDYKIRKKEVYDERILYYKK